jgi:hypothetical protein
MSLLTQAFRCGLSGGSIAAKASALCGNPKNFPYPGWTVAPTRLVVRSFLCSSPKSLPYNPNHPNLTIYRSISNVRGAATTRAPPKFSELRSGELSCFPQGCKSFSTSASEPFEDIPLPLLVIQPRVPAYAPKLDEVCESVTFSLVER